MRLIASIAVLLALAIAACGGGDDDEQASTSPAAQETTTEAAAERVPSDPAKLTCGHLKDPVAAGRASRQASNALAAEAEIKDLSQLQAAQSIYLAMTELCKEQGDDYKPAEDAVAAVKAGKFRADLGTP